jgi:glyoxylase-like metal-dependent hydrolase (beta-lactamase superfamily II)
MTHNIDRRGLLVGGTALGGMALAAGFGTDPAQAASAKAGSQVAGVQRLKVGDFEVTAILDGHIDLPLSLFPKADAAGVKRLQDEAFVPASDSVRGAINTYVVNTGDRLVLVDSGSGALMGPTAGKFADNLRAAGLDPAAIDTILVTHLHPDHIGGLFSKEGAALFPKAEMAVHEADIGFWTNAEIMAKVPDDVKPFFVAAQASLKAYGARLRRIGADGEVVKGISSMHLPGHTPGHTGYRVTSGNGDLLIWGDIVHAAVLQFARPDWALAFDTDQDRAIVTRKKVFDMASTDRVQIAGMHLPYPGIGHVAKAAEGYRYVKSDWTYTL